MSDTKSYFSKKAIDRFSLKKNTHTHTPRAHFWNQFNASFRTAYAISFEHEMTFRRTLPADDVHQVLTLDRFPCFATFASVQAIPALLENYAS